MLAEPEVPKQMLDSESPWNGKSKEILEWGSERPPTLAEARAEQPTEPDLDPWTISVRQRMQSGRKDACWLCWGQPESPESEAGSRSRGQEPESQRWRGGGPSEPSTQLPQTPLKYK